MIGLECRQRNGLLAEVERRLGYVGYAEYWLELRAPQRADADEMERWRALPTIEKMIVADRYDERYEALKKEVFREWDEGQEGQKLKACIHYGSLLLSLGVVLLMFATLWDQLVNASYHSSSVLLWWFTFMTFAIACYRLICHFAERCVELAHGSPDGFAS